MIKKRLITLTLNACLLCCQESLIRDEQKRKKIWRSPFFIPVQNGLSYFTEFQKVLNPTLIEISVYIRQCCYLTVFSMTVDCYYLRSVVILENSSDIYLIN